LQNYIKQEKIKLLIPAVKSGDRKAIKEFYDLIGPLMNGVCRRYLGNTLEAEDAFIESITKAIDKITNLKDNGDSVIGWCRKIAINHSLDVLRKNRNDLFCSEPIDSFDKPSEIPDIQTNLNVKDMLKLIDKLPSGYKTVFNMYVIDGYTHKEISKSLGIKESTSRTQLKKARGVLYNKLIH
jgi:RNA polymerase sigma-70 factor (ECF subfamily)